MQQKGNPNPKYMWIAGIGFTFLIAVLGYLLAKVPGFQLIGPLASAIVIAIIYRQIRGYPELLDEGIQFSSKKLLRLAIVLYGLKLNMNIVLQDGLGLIVRGSATIIMAILLTMWIAKLLKADNMISLLVGVGTGVCGAAAIAAVAPIIKSKDEDTAIGVGIIALVGTIFSIIYTMIRPILPITDIEYGIWSGISLHELAHVALAAAPAGGDALAIGLLAKLGRVFLLIPLCFIFIYWIKHKSKINQFDAKIAFPWFLIGFIIMSVFGSYVLGDIIPVTQKFLDNVSFVSTFILTMAMVGLGLNVSLQALRTKALKPLLAMSIASALLSVITYFTL
nr:putative sulfate exporter family transporter [Robertmurraya massiliosenegalensis]